MSPEPRPQTLEELVVQLYDAESAFQDQAEEYSRAGDMARYKVLTATSTFAAGIASQLERILSTQETETRVVCGCSDPLRGSRPHLAVDPRCPSASRWSESRAVSPWTREQDTPEVDDA